MILLDFNISFVYNGTVPNRYSTLFFSNNFKYGRTMKTVTEKAYAKINLYLDVVGKREDGYHDILSVMHTVNLYDTVAVELSDSFSMECTDSSLSCGEDNLCIKAARAFYDAYGREGGCRISLTKVIPSQAGLGGGSSDAAAVLRALNTLHGEALSEDTLLKTALKLGADVPFLVRGGSAICEGIGEVMTPFIALPKCRILISTGRDNVSTPQAYKIIDSTIRSQNGDFEGFKASMENGDVKAVCSYLYNRFEDTLPSCREIKAIMKDNGAMGALMSGSGSAVFGIFETEEAQLEAEKALNKEGLKTFRC